MILLLAHLNILISFFKRVHLPEVGVWAGIESQSKTDEFHVIYKECYLLGLLVCINLVSLNSEYHSAASDGEYLSVD